MVQLLGEVLSEYQRIGELTWMADDVNKTTTLVPVSAWELENHLRMRTKIITLNKQQKYQRRTNEPINSKTTKQTNT
jgi:hypothetical protein